MAQEGWISARWGTSENHRRARYYSITKLGLSQLAREEQRWNDLTGAVTRVLQRA
jgi:DNA-binding PadR family transcriptional regulator